MLERALTVADSTLLRVDRGGGRYRSIRFCSLTLRELLSPAREEALVETVPTAFSGTAAMRGSVYCTFSLTTRQRLHSFVSSCKSSKMIAHVLQMEGGMDVADDERRDPAIGEMEEEVDVEGLC